MTASQLDFGLGSRSENKGEGIPVKGYVPTPPAVVDAMVEKLFRERPPSEHARLLDPGCGTGAFIQGVLRWCSVQGVPVPRVLGIELNTERVAECRSIFRGINQIEIRQADFLRPVDETFDYIIGNPPYVPINELSEAERTRFRQQYTTAQGRFDLYLIFWEQALQLLNADGRLVFITPEKFLYVNTAAPLRKLLHKHWLLEFSFVDEATFGELVTYPVITTLVKSDGNGAKTQVRLRDGRTRSVRFPDGAVSWLPAILGSNQKEGRPTLADIAARISCGVATGADGVFVQKAGSVDPDLHDFGRPTLAGRDIHLGSIEPVSRHIMLMPYDEYGGLLPEHKLGALRRYLTQPSNYEKLIARTCVQRKPWYAFHETPPLRELLHPKILCKDIGASPVFVIDRTGAIVPRHSLYYIVPRDPAQLDDLARYLNSPTAHEWLRGHCQRAANGFLRVQSHVLKQMPVPEAFISQHTPTPSLVSV